MAASKSTKKVAVTRHAILTVKRTGGNSRREVGEELSRYIDQGYVISGFDRQYGGVSLHLEKTTDWTVEEVLSEVDDMFTVDP